MTTPIDTTVESALDALSTNCRELWAHGPVPTLARPPSALEFLRDYVGPSRPVLIRGLVTEANGWRGCGDHSWDLDALACRPDVGDAEVTVAATPSGWADAVARDPASGARVFAQPEERRMPFRAFAAALLRRHRAPRDDGAAVGGGDDDEVLYMSAQVRRETSETSLKGLARGSGRPRW